jgi:hypothetical protein
MDRECSTHAREEDIGGKSEGKRPLVRHKCRIITKWILER